LKPLFRAPILKVKTTY